MSRFCFPTTCASVPMVQSISRIQVFRSIILPQIIRFAPITWSVHYDGRLYRVATDDGAVTKLDEGILFTNGIAFGLDGMLYLNETVTGNIYRYGWRDGELRGPRTLFGNVIRADAPPGWKGPDGMSFDESGLLYVAVFGQGDVTVLGLNGEVVERISTHGLLPTNVAFALPGQHRIHVTEFQYGQVEAFAVNRDGLRLWDGTKGKHERLAQ